MKGKNVVVIMSDEHNPAFMGCSGHPFIKTPNLDALAARGARFPNAYTPSPICVPARAAFATGHRVHQTRHWDNAMPYVGDPQGWGHVLQQHGINVESIGKLHYRNEEDPVGFDAEHIPMHVVGGHGMVWASIRDPYLPVAGRKRMLGDRIGMGESPYTSYDRSVTERTLQWLRAAAERGQPFVLYVGLVAPHFPLIAPQEFFSLYDARQIPEAKLHPKNGYKRHPWVQAYAAFERSEETFQDEDERVNAFLAYYGLCSFLDSNVGRIVDELATLGLADSTHVVYTSDHGDNVGARGLWGKSTLYQESVGIPMILAGPDVTSTICETPVDLLDLYPTLLQAVGVDPLQHMGSRPGNSLFAIAAQPADKRRAILSEYHAAGSNTAGFMLRKGPWKYHHYVRFEPELFNLDSDPGELHDLAGDPAYSDVLADMKAALYAICDPEDVDRQAKADQAAMIERLGGVEVASTMGASGATPAPKAQRAA
ncbi:MULTISPECIES: sulfatase-like hydrolase/transferase [Achromobacter]|uniref:sulfatase-like hydrolase/transferase n=1 Tax=Achromobacter TaxID=222 RepID=UPI001CBAF334|nr:sulfatase-like hydrolase/transferase [Achromobacter mucicolens]MDH1521635.1 sulfatase-like hydrolase/transferase [Achromobacter mucicolens]UAN00596.1 sulfatase-like hydrolase/transferase [Achromobacter mucicolens]